MSSHTNEPSMEWITVCIVVRTPSPPVTTSHEQAQVRRPRVSLRSLLQVVLRDVAATPGEPRGPQNPAVSRSIHFLGTDMNEITYP